MKEQISKRYIASQRSVPKDSTLRSATYQHYYEGSKPIKNFVEVETNSYAKNLESSRSPSQGDLRIREEFSRTAQKRKNEVHMSNLKNQLQNLKLQVSKMMTNNKTQLTKTPMKDLEKKFFGAAYERNERNVETEPNDMGPDNDYDDTQSVTSERIIYEPLKKLEIKASTQNYDHSYYMQMEIDLLKTELRNLKNKYNAKKKELNEKCEVLEKKNEYLEISLHRSEESLKECQRTLETEVAQIRKQMLKQFSENQEDIEKIPTKDTIVSEIETHQEQNELIQVKLKKLYEENSTKTKRIFEISSQFEELQGQLERKTFELKKQLQKSNELMKQLEFSKRENARNQQFLETEISKKKDLMHTVESLKEKNGQLMNEVMKKEKEVSHSENYENTLADRIQEYRNREKSILAELSELKESNKKLKQLSTSDEEQINHLKKTVEESLQKAESYNKKFKSEQEKVAEKQIHYQKIIEEIRIEEEDKIRAIKQECENQIRLIRNASPPRLVVQASPKRQETSNQEVRDLQREIKKWKAQYKLLKGKYEERVNLENNRKQETKQFYRGYTQNKQKNDILDKRIKMLEKSLEKYLELLGNKETDFIKKEIEFRKLQNQMTKESSRTAKEIRNLQEQLKNLQEKYNEEIQKNEKETAYRKQIEQKIYNLKLEDEIQTQIQEILERMKKRVADQDEKLSKNVKQIKTKETLINKLKNEVKQILQTNQKQMFESKNKEMDELTNKFVSTTYMAFDEWKKNMEKEKTFLEERYQKILQENCDFKKKILDAEKEIVDLKLQTKRISHLYNQKCSEMDELNEKMLQEGQQAMKRLEELKMNKDFVESNLTNQILIKNEEVNLLRADIRKISQLNRGIQSHNFDEALKSQIEMSKTLREQINKKNEEIYKLRDSFSSLRSQYDNMKSQIQVNKLKFLSEKKNIEVSYQVEIQNLKNKSSIEEKKVLSFEQKIKLILEQNKKKDSFIQTYIMGKKLPQNQKDFIVQFVKQYQITLAGKDIVEKLQTDSQELEKMALYNYNLMKEIAQMKEKILLYEMSDNDKVSLYESRISSRISNNNDSRIKSVEDLESPKILKSRTSLTDLSTILN